MNETKDAVIELVSLYYNDKQRLNAMFDETNRVAPDEIAMRQRAKMLIEAAADKENAIQILNECL